MNIKIENAKYTNERGTLSNERNNLKTFNADITDLDGELFKGTIPYTFVDYYKDSEESLEKNEGNFFKVRKYIKSILDTIEIENYLEFEDNLPLSLYKYHKIFCQDIDDDCNSFIKFYDGIYFDNDIFDYSLDSQNIIANFISNYDHLIAENKIKKEDVSQDFISISNIIHKLNYSQLVELYNLMITRYSEIKLHARILKDKIKNSQDINEIKTIEWDLWVF